MFLGRLQVSWHIQQERYDLGLNSMFESCGRGLLLCLASFYVRTLFTLQGQKHICHNHLQTTGLKSGYCSTGC